jgi:hypothetical protein
MQKRRNGIDPVQLEQFSNTIRRVRLQRFRKQGGAGQRAALIAQNENRLWV